jgi:hypothetical protein
MEAIGVEMSIDAQASGRAHLGAAREYINLAVEEVMVSLPDPDRLSTAHRRGIIARYTAVLEGNFIYWMTATYLSACSAAAREIIADNLRDEVQGNHPAMLRRFALAAEADPTDVHRRGIERELQAVRAFVARLDRLQIILMMAFFEDFIQRFMPYLAGLAVRQGSQEKEYTDVHGVVDLAHTQGLLTAFAAELDLLKEPISSGKLFEGVAVLRPLIQAIICP